MAGSPSLPRAGATRMQEGRRELKIMKTLRRAQAWNGAHPRDAAQLQLQGWLPPPSPGCRSSTWLQQRPGWALEQGQFGYPKQLETLQKSRTRAGVHSLEKAQTAQSCWFLLPRASSPGQHSPAWFGFTSALPWQPFRGTVRYLIPKAAPSPWCELKQGKSRESRRHWQQDRPQDTNSKKQDI